MDAGLAAVIGALIGALAAPVSQFLIRRSDREDQRLEVVVPACGSLQHRSAVPSVGDHQEDASRRRRYLHLMELLRTENLLLRSWTTEDLDAFFDLYSRWEVARWLGRHPRSALATRDEARERLDRWRERNSAVPPPQGLWSVVPLAETGSPQVPIGTVLLLPLEGPGNEFEVGWHLHPAAQGHGYATRAARALIAAARASGITRVLALTDLENTASAGVARRLGMRDESETNRWFGLTTRQFCLEL